MEIKGQTTQKGIDIESNINEVLQPFEINGVWFKIKKMPLGKDLLKLRRITGFYELMPQLMVAVEQVKNDKEMSKKYSDIAKFNDESKITDLSNATMEILKLNDYMLDKFEENYDDYLGFYQYSFDKQKWIDLSINGMTQVPQVDTEITFMLQLAIHLFNACMVFMQR